MEKLEAVQKVLRFSTAIREWCTMEFSIYFDDFDEQNVDDYNSGGYGEIGTGYSLFGVDGSATTNWDIDDFSYEGLDIDAGYTWAVTDTFSVRPNVTVPFDEDFTRGDLTAGISISLSFGSSSTE